MASTLSNMFRVVNIGAPSANNSVEPSRRQLEEKFIGEEGWAVGSDECI